jgi:S-adenosylmethionine hydrolase
MGPRLITLTTDFGYSDPFVGTMKGVIGGINPEARIVDLTHAIPPQNVAAGALVLRYAAPFFPDGTIHVAVVDPGVGSERRPLLIETDRAWFVGPDNGLLSLAAKKVRRVFELNNDTYHLRPTSRTFHGRDIFAPIAAYLALGLPADAFGTQVDQFVQLDLPQARIEEGAVRGEIVYIDHFGNLITNISAQQLGDLRAERLAIRLRDLEIEGLSEHYAARTEGPLALINSWGMLEIAVFRASAAALSGATVGDPVEVLAERRSG